jgi:hypothetical protein
MAGHTPGESSLKGSWAIAVAVLGLLLPSAASGLSCARSSLDEATIDSAVVIFEGTAGPKRSPDSREKAAIRGHAIEAMGGGTKDLRVYSFTVTRGWKGATAGQSVDVLFNSYWGDGFAEGEAYLVVSPRQVGSLFWAPLCGHTIDMRYAAEIGSLAMLERLIGVGHHMKIAMEDRVCRRAEDCTLVQTHCGGCSCGTPAAKVAVEHYVARFETLCAAIRIAERCELDCSLPAPSCAAGYCTSQVSQ